MKALHMQPGWGWGSGHEDVGLWREMLLAGHRSHPWQPGNGTRPAAGFPCGQTVLVWPLVKPEAAQPVPGLGVCSLDLAFAASWPHYWQVSPWQPLPSARQRGTGRALTPGDLALWSQGCSLRPFRPFELRPGSLAGQGFLAAITPSICGLCLLAGGQGPGVPLNSACSVPGSPDLHSGSPAWALCLFLGLMSLGTWCVKSGDCHVVTVVSRLLLGIGSIMPMVTSIDLSSSHPDSHRKA